MPHAAADAFVPNHALVSVEGSTPARWIVFLHGIFGSGDNWRLFARRLCEACPGWGACLVDLRGHGKSEGALPPHTLDAAADDVLRLEERLGLSIGAIAGHSFGGKVMLASLLRRTSRVGHAFLVDSPPGERGSAGDAREVLALLRGVPQPLESRERFVEIVEAAGHSRAVADWLAMNVRRAPDGFRVRLDLPAIEAMLADYFARDLWRVVESRIGAESLDVVLGGRSDVIAPSDRARLQSVATRMPEVRLHVLEGAGHWVHVDDPDGLLAVMRAALVRPDAAT